jgi:hypothetical protein
MPYELLEESTFARLSFHGKIASQDLFSALRALEAIEARVPRVPDRLIDLTGITDIEFVAEDVFAVAERRRARRFPNRFKSALVAAQPVQVGYARMFQMLNEHPDIILEVFSRVGLAIHWLGSASGQPPDTA